MDLSWQHGLNDFYMLYRIQQQRSMLDKMATLEKEAKERAKRILRKSKPKLTNQLSTLVVSAHYS